jgi:Bacterial Ig-like domain
MKLFTFSPFRLVAALVMIGMLAGPAQAQMNAYDDAFHYTRGTNWSLLPTVTGLLNGGFGFTQWVLATNATVVSPGGGRGFFTTRNGTPLPVISSPTNSISPPGNDNQAHVWGIFANGSGINTTVAYRGFSNALDTTVAFKIDFETIGVGGAGKFGGFFLRNGNATNGTSDHAVGERFAFYYAGGGSNSFTYRDATGPNFIGIPFASNPLSCEFTLKADDTYRFVVKRLATGEILAIVDNGQLLSGSGTIDSVALVANQTDGNQNFNRMLIASTSLTPPTIINLSPTNRSIFVDPNANNVSFEVGSVASNIRGSNVTLRLNGVTQTGLTFNTSGPTNQLFVTNNTALLANLLYSASITVVDDNSNTATNNFTFNTFSPLNLCIDAEDYNYGGGSFFPNPGPNAYAGLLGTLGIDYFEVDPTGTNPAAFYRSGDLPQILLVTGDPYDHAGFLNASATDYELGFTDASEWQNFTRELNNTNYTIYARAASGGGGTIMVERLANATATTPNQPKAALGTCIIPATGGSKIYSGNMVPLTDFFGNTVQIRFPGTNTLRETAVNNRAYNLNYLMLVPNTNTATLKPYLSAGYPFPGAVGVALESSLSFTIANRQTAVNPATIQLFVNSNAITSGITLTNNAAGTVVTFVPSTFLTPNTNYTVTVVFTDNGGSPTTTTNTWQFTTANASYTILPPEDALPIGSIITPGFAGRIYKIDNAAPNGVTLAFAELELAGMVTNTVTSQPYPNLANGGPNADGAFSETNVLNYDITGLPTGTPAFPFKSEFPYVPANAVNNNIALETLMYLQLTNGNYLFAVRSDDGFRLTEGPASTNRVLGQFDGGRGNGTPTTMYVTVVTNGLYPMRLLYFQAGSGGNLEFYSVNNGTPVLINDSTNANAVLAFQALAAPALPVTILNPAHAGNATTFNFLTQTGHTHFVEYKNALDELTWTPLTTITGNGSITNVTDNSASNMTRFYRVRSQ